MGVRFSEIESKSLQLGNCRFEQGSINVPAGVTVKGGTILKRAGERKFAIASKGDTFVGVVPFDMTNHAKTPANLGFRAIIAGRVRRDMLNVDGVATITSAQADSLRDFCGIIAVDSTDISRVSP
ncbi:MAG: hypothetical protein FWC64_07100 [Treponema sp.]|nr:hypothetical protein [Treponema sp.]